MSNYLVLTWIRITFLYLALVLVGSGKATAEENNQVQRYTLENGLTVILKENKTVPLVAFQMWIKVGSADEREEEAGVTHLIEHMLFKGTAKRKVGEIAREVEAAGGTINAFTSYDQTVFYLIIPSQYFNLGLDIISDAIQNSSFESEELEREKEVVLEEVRMRTDHPSTKLNEALFSTIYTVHPYRRPIIGFETTVKNLDRKKVIEYYRTWYTPDNMCLVITGNFSPPEALSSIKRAFSGFTSSRRPNFKRPLEPTQNETRSIIFRGDVQQTYLAMAFPTPAINHPDFYPLEVLATILGEGKSSRLYQKVKSEQQLMYSIYASSVTLRDSGLLMVGGLLETGKIKPAVAEIFQEIYRLQKNPPSSEEISRAKLKLTSEFIYNKETLEGEGNQLGYFETVVGDLSFEQTYIDKINQVTGEDILRVAQTYLQPQKLTIGVLIPEKDKGEEITREEIKKIINQVKQPSLNLPESPSVSPTQKFILSNGITLIIRENRHLPIVSLQAAFLGGVRWETKENNGITNLIAEMLPLGTKKRSARDIAQEIESMAGKINGFAGRNSFGVSVTVLSQFFEPALELFSDILTNPSFSEEELMKKRTEIIAAIERSSDQPVSFLLKNFNSFFFGNHPYGMDVLGTKEVIKKLTSRDLSVYYSQLAQTKNLVITVVGDVAAESAKKMFETAFKEFPAHNFNSREVPPVLIPNTIREKVITQGKKAQAQILLGFPGIDIKSPDKYALDVLNTILAGQGGRLFIELRDKQSLAYTVTSFSWEGIDPGYIAFYIACEPSKVETAIESLKLEVKKIREEKVTLEELKRAQNYLVGSFSIDHQTNESLAQEIGFNELYGRGYSYPETYLNKIFQISVEDVQKAAQKYLDLSRYTLLIIKPEERKG